MKKSNQQLYLLLLLPFLIGFIYWDSIWYDFLINYDDDVLIFKSLYVINFSWSSIPTLFTSFIEGLYHPVTTLTWAADWNIGNGNPVIFHITNLLFHLANSLLVFQLIRNISKKSEVAIICALLFAVSPMAVENVAWLSSRKDLVYALFYLSGLVMYTQQNLKSGIRYAFTTVAFILSLLSKSAAVTFPIALIIIDLYEGKKFSINSQWNKIPLILLSVVFGVVNIKAQQSIDFIQDMEAYSIIERICMVSYSILFYPIKSLFPFELSAKYFYPISGQFSTIYYAAPFALVAAAIGIIKYGKKHPLMLFAAAFYVLHVALIIKIIPTGNDLINERYAYIANIALFYLLSHSFFVSEKVRNSLFYGGVTLVVLSYSIISKSRAEAWKDSQTLWTDVINRYPDRGIPYNERGQAYYLNNNFDASFLDVNKAIEFNPTLDLAYTNRGNIYLKRNQANEAIADFTKALELKGDDALIYSNRGTAYMAVDSLELALTDFSKSLSLDSSMAETFNSRAILKAKQKDYKGAIVDFTKALELNPNYVGAYKNRSLAYFYTQQNEKAIADMDAYQQLNPMDENKYIIYKGRQLTTLGALNEALTHFNEAIAANPRNMEAIYYRAEVKISLNDLEGAVEDYLKVIDKIPSNSSAHNNLANVYYSLGLTEKACISWQTAAGLGSKAAEASMEKKCD